MSAEVVQAVADHLHDAKLSGAVADVAAAVTVERRLRAELIAAEDLLTSYTRRCRPGNQPGKSSWVPLGAGSASWSEDGFPAVTAAVYAA